MANEFDEMLSGLTDEQAFDIWRSRETQRPLDLGSMVIEYGSPEAAVDILVERMSPADQGLVVDRPAFRELLIRAARYAAGLVRVRENSKKN